MPKTDTALYERLRPVIDNQKFLQHLGVHIDGLQNGSCEISLEYDDRWSQQNGYFHGGIIGTLADNAAGLASATTMGEISCGIVF